MKIHPRAYEVDLYRIVSGFELTFTVVECNTSDCPMTGLCEFKKILDKASAQFTKTLRQYRLNDIIPSGISVIEDFFIRVGR